MFVNQKQKKSNKYHKLFLEKQFQNECMTSTSNKLYNEKNEIIYTLLIGHTCM